MTNWLKIINDAYPIRRTKKQKENFIQYTKDQLKKYNLQIKADTLKNKHTNIIIGDVEKAKVIFTAHYDTPASSVFPNIMFPRNKIISYLYLFLYAFIIVVLSFALSFLINNFIYLDETKLIIVYMIIYLTLFYLFTRCFNNINNINDNTSGVATVFSLVENNKNKDVAYILFDNEEKGKLGSKEYSKKYSSILQNKLVVNFDCVGNGEYIVVVSKDKAIQHQYYNIIQNTLHDNDKFKVKMYGMKGSSSNTDFLNFECSLSIMACKKTKIIGYYTPNIHTSLDTVASKDNIEFLTLSFIDFCETI